MEDPGQGRTLGLIGATGVGVGAIVGGGIFVLAGTAFEHAGPSAVLAFALNGVIALLTAMSFAEMSSAFPENGGAYTFAKKVLSLRAAFAVGWTLWFAYIVAGVLYALGFASFAQLAADALWLTQGVAGPSWLRGHVLQLALASAATLVYAVGLVRTSTGGGQAATWGKVVGFALLVLAGTVALAGLPRDTAVVRLSPFFEGGAPGLLLAMGFTFIALQGFDLIAAVGSEVREPRRVIPRAMFLSLGCALAIYLPLLLLVSTVGVAGDQRVRALAMADPQNVIPRAAEQFMGPLGYWLVVAAALLSTLSALHANLLAASRVALSMARDRTLPDVVGERHSTRLTPVAAIYASTLTLLAILLLVPDLASAGAAASLIFLVVFALGHVTAVLARVRHRAGETPGGYRSPWFPAVPVVGGLACASLAVFQAVAVPAAGATVVAWLGLGVVLYWSFFARGAEIDDAAREGLDPTLVRLRGASPLVLVPIANPERAPGLMSLTHALVSRDVGRALLLNVVPLEQDVESDAVMPRVQAAQRVLGKALGYAYQGGYRPEALITAAPEPMHEIARIATSHRCAAVVLGLGADMDGTINVALDALIARIGVDVTIVRADPAWRLDGVRRVLVPITGRGDHHELRARLLGSITRSRREVLTITFVQVLPDETDETRLQRARAELGQLAELRVPGQLRVLLLCSDDPAGALVEEARDHDLMIVGLRSASEGRSAFGPFASRLAHEAPCATLFLGRRPRSALERLDPWRDEVVASLRDALPTRSARRARSG